MTNVPQGDLNSLFTHKGFTNNESQDFKIKENLNVALKLTIDTQKHQHSLKHINHQKPSKGFIRKTQNSKTKATQRPNQNKDTNSTKQTSTKSKTIQEHANNVSNLIKKHNQEKKSKQIQRQCSSSRNGTHKPWKTVERGPSVIFGPISTQLGSMSQLGSNDGALPQ